MYTKKEIAKARNVSERTVDNWRSRGLLAKPIKMGSSVQARVRWTDAHVEELDKKLAGLNSQAPV
jgi:DNA-binding transcriptional MerR regulator